MDTPKITEVSIMSLKVTTEDEWFNEYALKNGDSIITSPHYLYLKGNPGPMIEWMAYRNLPSNYIAGALIRVLVSIMKNGQIKPIKIYQDRRINTGHKRAACMLYLGYSKVKAEIIEDNYKL